MTRHILFNQNHKYIHKNRMTDAMDSFKTEAKQIAKSIQEEIKPENMMGNGVARRRTYGIDEVIGGSGIRQKRITASSIKDKDKNISFNLKEMKI